MYKPFFEFTTLHHFNPTDFIPTPNVNTCFVKIAKREFFDLKIGTKEEYLDFITFLFNVKGQTFKEKAKHLFTYEQIKRMRKQVNIDYDDNITIWKYESFLKLYTEFVKLLPNSKKSIIVGSYSLYKKQQNILDKIHRNRKF